MNGYDITLKQEKVEIIEPQAKEVREVAEKKIMQVVGKFEKPVMIDDSGLFIHALNGFPGAWTKEILGTIGVEGILKLLEGKDRKCEFKECLAYWEPGFEKPQFFENAVKGSLTEDERGEFREFHWSPFSLVFIPEELNKTLGEMDKEEYTAWSRSRTPHFKKLGEWLSKRSG